MVRIAITGGLACGKSLVGSFLRAMGVDVCEADEVAHELLRPEEAVCAEVVRTFGAGILDADGNVDRKALGRLVFSDSAALGRLNGLMHPEVRRRWRLWLAARPADCRVAATIVPLLYEVGEGEGWDAVLCVSAPPAFQWSRLLGERGLTAEEARRRLALQMSTREKERRADYVIWNAGTPSLLEEQVRRVMRAITEK
jgi:dephospho-CoA kinase